MTSIRQRYRDRLLEATITCVIAFGFLGHMQPVLALCYQEEDTEEAQEDQMQGGIALAPAMAAFAPEKTASKKYVQAVKKLDLILQLQLQVDEMKAVCGLEDSQVQKLNIAAKAAAQKQMEKWSKTMDDFQMWEPMGVDTEKEENVRVDEIDLTKLDSNIFHLLTTDFTGELREELNNDKIWKKALKSTLTEEQQGKLNAHHEKKNEKVLEATVQYFSRTYGSQIHLDAEQEKAFAKAIQKSLAGQNLPTSIDDTYIMLTRIASIPSKELEEFMSEKQMFRWQVLTGPYNHGGMLPANGVIIEEAVEDIPDNEETPEGDDG